MKSFVSTKDSSLKSPVVLVLGNNPFSKKGLSKSEKLDNYEVINLKYLPTLPQIEGLVPDLIIVNYNGYKDNSHDELNKLCADIKSKYEKKLPLICISSESSRKNIKESYFERVWNAATNVAQIYDEINDLLNLSRSQKELWSTLQELQDYKKSVEHELELASIFQGALFNKAIARTNLKTAYHYLFRKEIGGDFFRIFDLSASHVGVLIGDVRGQGAAGALLTGFILGELYAMSSEKQRILWCPSELLARLSESIYSHNKMSEICATAWYGVVDLTSGKIEFARAGHPFPIYVSKEDEKQEARFIEGGSGFPLGIFPGMTYRQNSINIPLASKLLFYTDGLVNQKDTNNVPVETAWLNKCFLETCVNDKKLKDIPAILDSTFTDLSQGAEPNDDRVILCCEIGSLNQSYVRVIAKTHDQNSESKLAMIPVNSFQMTIDQILASLPNDLDTELFSEFELALQELLFKANTQVQKARLIASSLGEECELEGFMTSWWVHDDRLDISLRLDQKSIPWSYFADSRSSDAENIEGASSLLFFFDNIQVDGSGLEISMSKVFGW